MGLLSSVGSIVGSVTGGLIDRSETRHQAKNQYKYNSWLQNQNEQFQKYMASNAHQLEMQDLKDAGLNPALTTHQSTAGSIAGRSAPQGTSAAGQSNIFGSTIKDIVDNINTIRQTNANINNINEQATLYKAQAISIIEKLPIEKREKETLIKKLEEETKYTGYFPTTIGNNQQAFGFGGGTTTTVFTKGGKIRNKTHAQ